jgi:hypothetical protein
VDVLPHPILELSGEFEHAEGDVVEFVEDGFFEITSITKLDDGRQLVKARRPPFGVA